MILCEQCQSKQEHKHMHSVLYRSVRKPAVKEHEPETPVNNGFCVHTRTYVYNIHKGIKPIAQVNASFEDRLSRPEKQQRSGAGVRSDSEGPGLNSRGGYINTVLSVLYT